MKTNYLSEIIHRYFSDEYPPEMQEKLQAWLLSENKATEKEKITRQLWDELQFTNDESVYASLKEVKKKLGFKHFRLHPPLLSIAAIFLLCLMGSWWYYFSIRTEWIHITTAYGETAQCLLPDSSLVWINSGSTLSYPQSFKAHSRQVRLSGEARFSVTKDARHPFQVKAKTCTIEVLGTIFQLSDYPENQQTIARLEEGKIQITLPQAKKYILTPNQKIIIDKTTHTAAITSTGFPSWEEAGMIFEDLSLHDIFQALKRHYAVPLVFQDFHPDTHNKYSIKFTQEETVEQALDLLQALTENFIWTKQNNQIIIRSWHK